MRDPANQKTGKAGLSLAYVSHFVCEESSGRGGGGGGGDINNNGGDNNNNSGRGDSNNNGGSGGDSNNGSGDSDGWVLGELHLRSRTSSGGDQG
ncbi:unnamed protein product [Lampetra planeri]